MPRTKLFDEAGSSIDVVDIDGVYICDFHLPDAEGTYRSIKTWKAREDDVMIWAYPKSGTHWLWDMLYQIYSAKIDTVDVHKRTYMLEGLTEEKFGALPSPRLLNSHIDLCAWPRDFLEKRCKIIYVVRNPKDVAVSFYNHHSSFAGYDGKWENYLRMFLDGKVDSGSWFNHVKQYEELLQKHPDYPIQLLHYEDLDTDGISELRKLTTFLNLDVEIDTLAKVYEKNKFENVKKDKQQLVKEERLRPMWLKIYRKGKVGDWMNTFTVAQNEMFDDEYNRRTKESKVSVKWRF